MQILVSENVFYLIKKKKTKFHSKRATKDMHCVESVKRKTNIKAYIIIFKSQYNKFSKEKEEKNGSNKK